MATITGGPFNEYLRGFANDDLIQGLGGDDTLEGGPGADTLDGGTGIDTASYVNAPAAFFVNLTSGTGSVGEATGDVLISIENLIGSAFNDVLIGNADPNVLEGGDGDDVLFGAAGADTMFGGRGDDTYYLDNPGDLVFEAANAGLDRVFVTVSYTLSPDLEALFLQGTATRGVGNSIDNTIVGNLLSNILEGGEGNDELVDGGGGLNTLIGGNGNDNYFLSVEGSTITETPAGGFDRIFATVSVVMADNVEALILHQTGNIYGIGNASDNGIVGNGGSNVLSGGAGNDLVYGFGGNDTFVFRQGYGNDIVADFQGAGAEGGDVLQIDLSLAADFATFQSFAVQNGPDAVYTFGPGTTLTLFNVIFAGLIPSDVLFA